MHPLNKRHLSIGDVVYKAPIIIIFIRVFFVLSLISVATSFVSYLHLLFNTGVCWILNAALVRGSLCIDH